MKVKDAFLSWLRRFTAWKLFRLMAVYFVLGIIGFVILPYRGWRAWVAYLCFYTCGLLIAEKPLPMEKVVRPAPIMTELENYDAAIEMIGSVSTYKMHQGAARKLVSASLYLKNNRDALVESVLDDPCKQ